MDAHDTPNRSLDLEIMPAEWTSEDENCYDSDDSNCYGTLLSELSAANYDELFRCDN